MRPAGVNDGWQRRERARRLLAKDRRAGCTIVGMQRTDVYLKVELVHGDEEDAAQMAEEICRRLQKLYGVRTAEVQSLHGHTESKGGN